jgi:hypothetical protein
VCLIPESTSSGVWSEPDRVKPRTETKGKYMFPFHTCDNAVLFFISWIFPSVSPNELSTKENNFSRILTLNDGTKHKRYHYFSSCLRSILKYPPNNIGSGSFSHTCTSSDKKLMLVWVMCGSIHRHKNPFETINFIYYVQFDTIAWSVNISYLESCCIYTNQNVSWPPMWRP